MKKVLFCVFLALSSVFSFSQALRTKLRTAIQRFEADSQMKHGIMSLYVIDAKTGTVVFDKNSQVGLAAASTQKLITAVAALDILGSDFRFKTEVVYDGIIEDGLLKGNLFIVGYGDPTLGSWRWDETREDFIFKKILNSMENNKIKSITGEVYIDDSRFSIQPLPEGWIWQDIGNYYGAGTWALNWHENQYDVVFNPGKREGDTVQIVKTNPELKMFKIRNEIKTGKKGSGDNAYIYFPPYSQFGFMSGTIPLGEPGFTISGSIPHPAVEFAHELEKRFGDQKIRANKPFKILQESSTLSTPLPKKVLVTHYSPSLDSIDYWFLKKSINLYGEALLKIFAYQKNSYGSIESGLQILKDFWKSKGIEESSINITDGSGLSPQNRITTNTLVKVLQYAKTRPWYQSFYNALPEFNGMKMKSGSIGGVRSYAGYHKNKDNKEYIFAIIVNNYSGSSSSIIKKMWRVLDELK